MRFLLAFTIFIALLSFGCDITTNYDEASYPTEGHFAANDTMAFFLNDLLWVPLGRRPKLKWGTEPIEFNYVIRYEEKLEGYRLEINTQMRLLYEGGEILNHYLDLDVKGFTLEEVPGTIVLGDGWERYLSISDRVNDRFFRTAANYPVELEFSTFDTLSKEVEVFFSGQLISADSIGEVLEVREGRITMTLP